MLIYFLCEENSENLLASQCTATHFPKDIGRVKISHPHSSLLLLILLPIKNLIHLIFLEDGQRYNPAIINIHFFVNNYKALSL